MDIAKFSSERLVTIVSNLIDIMLMANNKIPNTEVTCFYSRAVPNIPILSYITRIHKYTPFTNEVLLSILIYFDRISRKDSTFAINSYNIHRLLIASIVVAAKYTSDIYYANNRYAKVGGIPLQELNQLELKFLKMIDFELYISLEDLQEYANQLLHYANTSIPDIEIPNTYMNINSTFTATTTITTTTTRTRPSSSSSQVLPLTPPYLPSINPKQKYHPYQRPILPRKKLGLVSPKV